MSYDEARDDGGSAFPVPIPNITRGMTLRDWFAGQALAGLVAHTFPRNDQTEVVGDFCYTIADAMLAERNKP